MTTFINIGLWLGLILMVFAIWWAFLAPTAPRRPGTVPTDGLPRRDEEPEP